MASLFETIIYPDEADIAQDIIKSSVISSLVEVSASEPFDLSEQFQKTIASETKDTFDLHYLKAILMTSTWNGNDELFLPSEVFKARHTPKDKPFNFEHQEDDIIGHMTAAMVIDEDGQVIPDDIDIEKLPDTIHIVNHAVLYKHWENEDKSKRIHKIISELPDKWFVSVECLFPNFDYALKSKNGDIEIIKRNKQTSFLTKHLRLFKGTGSYNGKQIARVPRDFIVSGEGLVENPANKQSIIFANQNNISHSNSIVSEDLVYKSSDDLNTKVNTMNEAQELEYKNKIKELTEAHQKLTASISEGELNKVKASLETVQKDVESKDQEINVLKASIEKLHAEKAELVKAQETLETEKVTLATQLEEIQNKAVAAERLTAAKTVYTTDEDAQLFLSQTDKMPKEAFDKLLEFNKKFMSQNAQVVETSTVVTKEQLVESKNTQVVDDPALVVTQVDEKAEVQKLVASMAAHVNTFKVKSGAKPKFSNVTK